MLAQVFARARSFWRGIRRRPALDAEMSEEFQLHLELRAEDLVKRGYSPEQARRQARLEFGSTDHYKDVGAESRGLKTYDGLRVSWLDFKLGFRMLARYPGLTIVGGIAMTFGIASGTAAYHLISQFLHPHLPLDAGDRVVAVRLWDAAANETEQRVLRDFAFWRAELRSVEELSLFRTMDRNLVVGNAVRGEPVVVAEINAQGMAVARVKPLLGRALTAADEVPGSTPPIVIGYDVWQSRLNGDPNVLGQTIRLGAVTHTIVGVMPKGYAFPLYHNVWTPFRLNPADYPLGGGPPITRVFGRLRDGATLQDANAELIGVMQRHAAEQPRTRGQVRAELMPYPKASFMLSAGESWMLASVNLFLAMLMALVCGNVALLMFARASAREGEIVVRTALGASRSRIITQLFAEALVLGAVSLVAGIVIANAAVARFIAVVAVGNNQRIPFWFNDHLLPQTILYAVALTLLGAAIAGVLPALKVTRGLDSRLRQAALGGSGIRFSGVWTALIVAQIAITVAFPVTAFLTRRDATQIESLNLGLAAREYLSARLSMDRDLGASMGDTSMTAFRRRFAATAVELQRRIETQPSVKAMAFATVLPGMYHPQFRIEVDGESAAPNDSVRGHRISAVSVSENYFDVAAAPLLAGRAFTAADRVGDRGAIVVNQSFVRDVLGGRSAIGRRVRYVSRELGAVDRKNIEEPSAWYEIVGVVKDLAMTNGSNPLETGAGMYHPLPETIPGPVLMAIHIKGNPRDFAPTMRSLALALDPSLRLDRIIPLSDIQADELRGIAFWFRVLVSVSLMALLLSLAAIYSVMAFAVARRTREIGVRIALGSDRRRIVAAIFARPLRQVSLGILVGAVMASVLVYLVFGSLSPSETLLLVGYAMLMLVVCLLACVVPTRRALAIQPTEALRSDG